MAYVTEKKRIKKSNQLNHLYAIIDRGRLHYTTRLPACIALGPAAVMTIKHGIITGVLGFVFGFFVMHICYHLSWMKLKRSVRKLKNELRS